MGNPKIEVEHVLVAALALGKPMSVDTVVEAVREHGSGDSTDAKFAMFKLVREGRARFDDAVLPSCLSELDDNLYDAVRTVAEARADLSDVLNDLWLEMCAQQPD